MMPVIWLLGLSGSGKTSLGSLLRLYLESQGMDATFIDGDSFRRRFGLSDVSSEERARNMDALRAHTFRLQRQGKICVVAAITPCAWMRRKNRTLFPLYHEVWVRCSLQTLKSRDARGLYARAALKDLSGAMGSFETPYDADSIIDTDGCSLGESYQQLRDATLRTLHKAQGFGPELAPVLPLYLPQSSLGSAIAL